MSAQKVQVPQVIRDYKQMIYKLYNRKDLRVEQKIQKLNDLALKFMDGWPFGEKNSLSFFGGNAGYRNTLLLTVNVLRDRIERQMKIEQGQNLGRMDRTELDGAKVHTTIEKKAIDLKI
jgi:hypothetical protein